MFKRIFAVVALAVLAGVLLGSAVTPWDPGFIDEKYWHGDPVPPCFVNAGSCGGHVLGTDDIGRDLLSRLFVATRTSLSYGLLAVFFEAIAGLALGALARYGGFLVRFMVTCFADAAACFPLWPIIVLVAVFGVRGHATLNAGFIAAAAGILLSPKLVRSMALGRPLGNLKRCVLRRLVRDFGNLILLLATIDFVGWGVQPAAPSLGNMLADAEQYIDNGWWIAVFPTLAIVIVVLAIELARRAYLGAGERLSH
jgi:peptide/nickel transport system permease protein